MNNIPDLNWNEYKRYSKAWDMFLRECELHGFKRDKLNEAKQALNKKPMHKTLLRKPNT